MDEETREAKVIECIDQGFNTMRAMKEQGCCPDDSMARKLDRCLQRMKNAGKIQFHGGRWNIKE